MTKFANGTQSKAICDRCGFKYYYLQLKKEWTGFRTCMECWEPKHPQLDPIYPPTEPQALYQPRPDVIIDYAAPVADEVFPFLPISLLQGITQIGIVKVEIT